MTEFKDIHIVLVGNSLALIVAALELVRKNFRVAIINDHRAWGGHFASVSINNAKYDAGMILLEFTSFNKNTTTTHCLDYNPWIRNSCGHYTNLVEKYVSNLIDTRRIASPKMLCNGIICDDLVISNKLSGLLMLPFKEQILADIEYIEGCASSSLFHASNKLKSPLYSYLDFEVASVFNHGETLHKSIIEPFANKVINTESKNILAVYHRAAWLPLFFPESIKLALVGKDPDFPETFFNYPCGETIGGIIYRMICDLKKSLKCTFINEKVISVSTEGCGRNNLLRLSNGKVLRSSNVVWGYGIGELMSCLGYQQIQFDYNRTSITLAFIKIDEKDLLHEFTVLNVIDKNFCIYRITNQTLCSGLEDKFHRLAVELNTDYMSIIYSTKQSIDELVCSEIFALGIISKPESIVEISCVTSKTALAIPNQQNLSFFLQEQEALYSKKTQGISIVGTSTGFFSSSFNDQVVQGIKISEQMEY